MIPNVIIGGAQKSGTTSLFRYLASHPSVCASSIKETNFFLKSPAFMNDESLKEYEPYFSHCSSSCPIRLEASPQYLMFSDKIAKRINDFLPGIKLLFILREPVSVLLSYIKFKRGISQYDLNLESFIKIVKNDVIPSNTNQNGNNKAIQERLQVGWYYKNLNTYLNYFKTNQIGIFFYDDLFEDNYLFMKKICNFINIDSSYYKTYLFRIENKTRLYKSPEIHRFVSKLYLNAEPIFNRYPSLRNLSRNVYHSIFELSEDKESKALPDTEALYRYYKEPNKKLRSLLMNNYPHMKMPLWLK